MTIYITLINKIIYLFIREIPNPATARSVRVNAKEREKKERKVRRAKKRKGIEAQRAKLSISTRTTDALTGNEEKNEKEKKETGSGSPTHLPWRPSGASYDLQGHTFSLFF